MLLLGTRFYEADSVDGNRRQQNSIESLRRLQDVRLVNLQFDPDPQRRIVEGFAEARRLKSTAHSVTGNAGPIKPLANEVFGVLAEMAAEFECEYFGFLNADIQVTQQVLDMVRKGRYEAYIFSRTDVSAGNNHRHVNVYGTDLFVVQQAWWTRWKGRFRPYILGEACWDNVYTAQLLCHARAILLNREPLIFHERHPVAWHDSPFAAHNGRLCALDNLYFSMWAEYIHRLEQLRARQASAEEEIELQSGVFRWPPPLFARLKQMGRSLKVRMATLTK